MPRESENEDVLFEDEEDLEDTGPLPRDVYSTPGARSLAYSTFQRISGNSPKLDAEEELAFKNYEKSAQEIRAQLVAARERLLAQKKSKSQALLAAASGLLRPTRTGSAFESAGYALEGALPEIRRENEAAEGRQRDALNFSSSISGIDQNVATQRLKLIQARRAANAKLLSESLKIASRPDKPGAVLKPSSTFGKIAADEGLRPGTPAFAARVDQLRQEDIGLQREKSGTDVDQGLSREDRTALAQQFGVPLSSIDPYQGLSTKARQTARQRAATQTTKDLEAMGANISGLYKTDQDVDTFLSLNQNVSSGPVVGRNPFGGADASEMDSITSRMARQVRQPGEGQVSNYDAQQFVKGTISRTKPYKTNQNIGKALKINNQQQRDRIKFFNDYATVNDGSLNGAMAAWIEYLDANPIFDPKTPGTLALNPNRKSYREYFNAKGSARFAEGGEVDLEELIAADQDLAGEPAGAGTILKPKKETAAKARQRLQAALQGLTYGLSDELGGLSTLATEGDYTKGRDYVRRNLEEGSNDSPISMFGTEVAGALPPALLAQQALSKLSDKYDVQRVGRANTRTGRTVQLLTRLAPKRKLVKAAVTGTVAGGAAGLNSEGDLERRLQRGQDGALFGAVVGPLASKTGEVGGKIARKVIDKVTGRAIPEAERRVAEAMIRDGVDPATVASQSAADARATVPSRLADFGGGESQALAQNAMSRQGPEARALLQETQNLQQGARGRVEDQINKGLKPDPFFDQEQKLVASLKTNATPLYDQANKVNVTLTPELKAILATPTGAAAYKAALKEIADDQVVLPPAPRGTINTQVLQYVKENLGARIRAAGADPGGANAKRIYTGLQTRLVALIDRVNPMYRQARQQYGDDAEVLGALRAGREQILDLQPEQIAAQVQGLSFAARDALRTGVARSLIEELKTPRRAKNFAELIRSPMLAQQLTAIFERPADAKIFMAALQREAELYGTRQTAARTAQQIQGQNLRTQMSGNPAADAAGLAGDTAGIGAAAMGDLGGLQIISRVLGALRNRITLSDAAAEDVARLLRTGTPQQIRQLMANFEKYSALARRRADLDSQLNPAGAASAGSAFGSANPQGYIPENQ